MKRLTYSLNVILCICQKERNLKKEGEMETVTYIYMVFEKHNHIDYDRFVNAFSSERGAVELIEWYQKSFPEHTYYISKFPIFG